MIDVNIADLAVRYGFGSFSTEITAFQDTDRNTIRTVQIGSAVIRPTIRVAKLSVVASLPENMNRSRLG